MTTTLDISPETQKHWVREMLRINPLIPQTVAEAMVWHYVREPEEVNKTIETACRNMKILPDGTQEISMPAKIIKQGTPEFEELMKLAQDHDEATMANNKSETIIEEIDNDSDTCTQSS
jgi:hypothetical protein